MILALQLLLSLSILIVLHELGHFIPAKLFKTRVEKFYLFFDPWFSLIKKKIGETTYGIGWLPLGGYVKISGMVDESMDRDQLARPAEPWEFRAKPAWQRLIIMLGGVTVNVLVGIIIYSIVLFVWGKEHIPVSEARYGVHCAPFMNQFGFRDGDHVVALDGKAPESFAHISKQLVLDDIRQVTVIRYGKEQLITLPEDFGQMLVDSGVRQAFALRYPCVVDSVTAGMPAARSGLLAGDSIVGVNQFYSPFFQDIQRQIRANANMTISLHVIRSGQPVNLRTVVTAQGTIGFIPKAPTEFFRKEVSHFSLAEAIPAGFREAWGTVTDYTSQLRYLFSRSGAQQVGGFVTFAKLFPQEWDWWAFWERTAFISLVLAFMNILPIPALDGGHVMFLFWEMATGKAVSQKILERAQFIGMMLLLGLMLYGNGMDLFRVVTGQ